jgi:hypothetical protein
VVILSWSSTGLHLPLLFFCFNLLFITICCTCFYLFFVLVFYLLPLSLVPAFHSTSESGVYRLCMWYFYDAIAMGYNFPPSIVLFQITCLLSKYFLSFLPLCYCECSPVSCHHTNQIPSITVHFSLAALTTICPCIQPLATTLLADTILLRIFTTYTLPYINSVLGLLAFFWIHEP